MNLATRPFYNDRAVHLVLAAVGLVVVTVLLLGGMRLVELSRTHRALTLQAENAEREAAAVSAQAARLERAAPADALEALRAAAEEANRLIERRLFSWTALFNVIEQTLPSDVMLTAVRPDADAQGASVELVVIGRRVADIEEFIRRLEETGRFEDVLARQGELDDEGMYRAQLRGRLVPVEAIEVDSADDPAEGS
jgi:hypothetical protein